MKYLATRILGDRCLYMAAIKKTNIFLGGLLLYVRGGNKSKLLVIAATKIKFLVIAATKLNFLVVAAKNKVLGGRGKK